jgi:hypothetical protein
MAATGRGPPVARRRTLCVARSEKKARKASMKVWTLLRRPPAVGKCHEQAQRAEVDLSEEAVTLQETAVRRHVSLLKQPVTWLRA